MGQLLFYSNTRKKILTEYSPFTAPVTLPTLRCEIYVKLPLRVVGLAPFRTFVPPNLPSPSMRQAYLFLIAAFLLITATLSGQTYTVSGTLLDAETRSPLDRAQVIAVGTERASVTDENGRFTITKVPSGKFEIEARLEGFAPLSRTGVLTQDTDLGTLRMVVLDVQPEDQIPTIVLTDEDFSSDDLDQNVSSLLTASRDVFVAAAAFRFSAARFRIRGYDSENTTIFLNGAPMNELENGRPIWSSWGGLNDVLRNRQTDFGLNATAYTFGNVGGAQAIDLRASKQRAGSRLSYYNANRTYSHRVMATHSTGLLANGWAFSASASRRWAQEAYIPGTFYDAYSYYFSADRKISEKSLLSFTVFGAPNRRGRPSGSTQEVYDLVDDVYYNPNWGFQNGEVRNSRVQDTHQPVFLLQHEWTPGKGLTLNTTASYQLGGNSTTRLDWFDAPDPRPDYYRNLPSFIGLENPELGDQLADNIRANPELLQVQWNDLYRANRSNPYKFNDEPGQWSQYVVQRQHFDSKELNLNAVVEKILSDQVTVNGGLRYSNYRGDTYQTVDDLLGGDYYTNLDRFAIGDPTLPPNAEQFDVDNPDRIIRQGDRYGYSYTANIDQGEAWGQVQYSFRKLDFFLAGQLGQTTFWRTGDYRNGRFPDSSLGDSEKQNFVTGGFKTGATLKLDGRNYLYANGLRQERAPFFRNAYVSPRTRDELVPNLENVVITSGEIGYQLRSPNFKGRATAFFTRFENELKIYRFFIPGLVTSFGNYILSGTDREHQGIEAAFEWNVTSAWTLDGAAALGNYTYTSRPNGTIVTDDNPVPIDRGTVYVQGLRVPGTPQTAATLGIGYNSPKFWFAKVNANFFANRYLDFSPERRLAGELFGLDPTSDIYRTITGQTQLDNAYTVDFFGGKSFKLNSKTFVNLTVGVNNILNNRFISGGFEQLRFNRAEFETTGVNLFPPRLYYAFGTNYFAMITLRRR